MPRPDETTFSLLAVLKEINDREFRKRLQGFPEKLHYYVVLAAGIIGAENSKRISETPAGVAEQSDAFIEDLLKVTPVDDEKAFRELLEVYIIKTLESELRFCCVNCRNFEQCLDAENLSVGQVFKKRVYGDETAETRKEITLQVERALRNTPYTDSDDAHLLCDKFIHQYTASDTGEVFGRYASIASGLSEKFGIDYKAFQQQMIEINISFFKKSQAKEH
ncbi:MAG: hypothetical protein HQL09_01280 [Nitrospirae bacterium]|nr:hypothetical protein [Nitrospirota bacterium]